MIVDRRPYKSIQQTIDFIKVQIIDSQDFAIDWLQDHPIGSPEELFYELKEKLYFTHDPKGVELLQTMQTLMTRNNYHGLEGAGDCDCFVITVSILSLLLGFKTQVVLAGRSRKYPVHIYNIINNNYFDLTEKFFGRRRYYPYYQILDVKEKILRVNPEKYLNIVLSK